jgi:hypothetical protein
MSCTRIKLSRQKVPLHAEYRGEQALVLRKLQSDRLGVFCRSSGHYLPNSEVTRGSYKKGF